MAYGGIRPSYRVTRRLLCEHSQHQEIMIFETPVFGRMLVLDGIVQVAEKDEFIYHEMMTHVPFVAHGNVLHVLVIGGGDGGILREVLKHNIRRATLVEIDQQVITRCREFMPFLSNGAFGDKRTNLVIGDGMKYISTTDDKFDVIIVDSTDRLGPGRALYTPSFYRNCQRCLNPEGILVNQNGVPFLYPDHITLTYRRRRKYFSTTSLFVVAIPSLHGGLFAFGWATNSRKARQVSDTNIRRRYVAAKLGTKYYTPEMHRACFALPPFVQNCLR